MRCAARSDRFGRVRSERMSKELEMVRDAAVAMTKITWSMVPETEHAGETGTAWWRTVQAGALRIRQVRYSPGYRADHWCSRGHVVLVLEGEILTETKDGKAFVLAAGQSYVVSDGQSPHRSITEIGARLFIVD